jgi:ABC-type transporter Mla subunit MlaD
MMRVRAWIVGVSLLSVLGLAGCGGDSAGQEIEIVLTALNEAGVKLSGITKSLNQTVELTKQLKGAGEQETAKLTEELKNKTKAVLQEIKDFGEQATHLRQAAQSVRKPPETEEDRKKLVAKVSGRLTEAMKTLQDNRKLLNDALTSARSVLDQTESGRKELETIEHKLREADAEFEALSRPQ